ncbi:MAG: NAD(P)-dependent glycerol-3-phosphate dehydrogenase [Rhizobiales bacterium]|nr:NAD(P)-dependent glycerol-3-phosphate dehydrogenase [Hyphomicrobiales bacterium]
MTFDRISVLGAGAWGTALSAVAVRAGRKVTLWEYDAALATALKTTRVSKFLPNHRIDDTIAVTSDLAEAARADAILLVVPAQALRSVAKALQLALVKEIPVIACAKGIERGTRKFMTEILGECTPLAIPAILSGPSFAADVARGLPTAVTLATKNETLAVALAEALGSRSFRPYQSTDVRGVEIGGAAKNVLAIAAGIVAGRGLGESAAAALTTRGFAELVRFGNAHGARTETMMGLSGLGDLILTCSSPQSRNFSLGVNLGKGHAPSAGLGAVGLAEGAFTAQALAEMGQAQGVEMPIVTAVADIIEQRASVDQAIEMLLNRPIRAE